jgi:hypothetical protein
MPLRGSPPHSLRLTKKDGDMTPRRPLGFVAFALVAGLAAASCAGLSPPRLDANQTLLPRAIPIAIAGGTLEIHLALRNPPRANAPLVVFASGDGGWFGAAVGMFATVASAGYPVVGLSSRGLLRTLRTPGHPLDWLSPLEESRQ